MPKMSHPEIEAMGEYVTEEQFEQLYEPRGWSKVDEPTAFANEVLGRFIRSTDDLETNEARALLANRPGVEAPDPKAKPDAIKSAFVESFGDPVAVADPEPPGIVVPPFDPNSENADVVLAHLDRSDAAEQERVLAIESGDDGRKRKSVLAWVPTEPAPEPPAGDNEGN